MVGLRRALIALFVVGVIFAALDVSLVLTSTHEPNKAVTAILAPLIGLSFIGTGVFAWWRRPLNRFGLLMLSVGFAWFLAGLAESNNPTVFTIGVWVAPLYLAIVVHMVLAFPTGRLETIGQRAIIIAGYLTALLVRLPFILLGGDLATGFSGLPPENAFQIADAPDLAALFDYTSTFIALVLLVTALVLLVRSRHSRAGAVGALIERLTSPDDDQSLAQALAEALGDRSLKLVYWRPTAGHYVTYDGRAVELPVPGSGRAVTEVERDGIRVGAIIHDEALREEPGLVRAVAASAALALENERLEAELRARLDELQSSRAR